jgi:hypothetical protein
LSERAIAGIKPMLNQVLKQDLIRCCRSPYNNPILLIKNPERGKYRFAQDLKAINITMYL